MGEGMSFTDLPPGSKPAPSQSYSDLPSGAKPVDQPSILQKIGGFLGAPDPVAGAGQPLNQQFMDFLNRAITIAPWALGGSIGPEGAMEAGAIKAQAGVAADAAAARPGGPTGPWGPRGEPPNPVPSPVPKTGGPTFETLAAGDHAAGWSAHEAAVTKALSDTLRRTVSGYNLNAAKTAPEAVATRTGQGAVQEAMNNLMPPPPKPPGMEPLPEPSPMGARPPSTITPEEIKAFLTKNDVAMNDINAALQEHAALLKQPPAEVPAPIAQAPKALGAIEKATKSFEAAATKAKPAPKAKAAAPGPPPPREVYAGLQGAKEGAAAPTSTPKEPIPTDPLARSWLQRAAGVLRTGTNLTLAGMGHKGPLVAQAIRWVARNFPEIQRADHATLKKVGDALAKALQSGK